MQSNRYVALIQAPDMARARELGMTNFSGFVNGKIKEFIADRSANLPQNGSKSATVGSSLEGDNV